MTLLSMNYSLYNTLNILAKRNNPKSYKWFSMLKKDGQTWLIGNLYRCEICDMEFISNRETYKHGMQHLKEYGLIAFL